MDKDKRKDPSIKIRNLVFYNPTKEELFRCSTSRENKSKRFFREESSMKVHTAIESSGRAGLDDSSRASEFGFNHPQTLQDAADIHGITRAVSMENRSISPQKFVSKLNKAQYLPSLGKEGQKEPGSATTDKETMNEMIENTFTRENKAELNKIYKSAKEFQSLKLGGSREQEKTKITQDSERIKLAMNKLLEDKLGVTCNNIQNVRTDISHFFNEKRSKSPEQPNKNLPEIKDQFKKKFTKLLQDISEDSNLVPEKNYGFSTNRISSILPDNDLKSTRFLNCETSPPRKNLVFTSLHRDIRTVQTPMVRARHDRGISQEKAQAQAQAQSGMSSSQIYFKGAVTGVEFGDDMLLQSLKKELPNVFSSNPSNRQEVLLLGNWLISSIKGIQNDNSMSTKEKYYKADEIYNICFNELIRQVSFDCLERAELIMKIWKAYIGLSQDIIADIKEKEKAVIAKANMECDKVRDMYQKILEDKDKEIARIKEDLEAKVKIIRDREDRINRFDEDQSTNINQAKQSSEALGKLQKLYKSLKLEFKDLTFKYEKVKSRLNKVGDTSEDSIKVQNVPQQMDYDIESDSSSEAPSGRGFNFVGMQQKIVKKEERGTSTSDLIIEGPKKVDRDIQTDLNLMNIRYDPLLRSIGALDEVLMEQAAKEKLQREGELLANMNQDDDEEDDGSFSIEDGQMDNQERLDSIIGLKDEDKSPKGEAQEKGDKGYKINIHPDQQQPETEQAALSLLHPKSNRKASMMSNKSDRSNKSNKSGRKKKGSRKKADQLVNMSEPSETESFMQGNEDKQYDEAVGDKSNLDDVQKGEDEADEKMKPKAPKDSRKKSRLSTRDVFFGRVKEVGDLMNKGKKEGSVQKKGQNTSQSRVEKKGEVSSSPSKRLGKKGSPRAEIPSPLGQSTMVNSQQLLQQKAGQLAEKREKESESDNFSGSDSFAKVGTDLKLSIQRSQGSVSSSSRNRGKTFEAPNKDKIREDIPEDPVNEDPSKHGKKDDARYGLKIPLFSPSTTIEVTPKYMKGSSFKLDESPREEKTSSESGAIRKVSNAIKALKRLASTKKSERKSIVLNGIAETLAQVDEDNEVAAQLMEDQEQKIIRFSNLYKIEKKKQDDLRLLNRELEKQVINDGAVIENLNQLVGEISQEIQLTEHQRKKVENIITLMQSRTKHLASIDELKPKLDPAFAAGKLMQSIKKAADSPRRKLFEEAFTLDRLLPESQYKGDFMVDVMLSAGQKHFLMEKMNNPVHTTITKVKKEIQSGKDKQDNCLPIKSVLKQITLFYTEKVHQGRDNPILKEQDMGTFVYKQFINTYGMGRFAINKFIKFFKSLKRYISINRVCNFAKMVGILDQANYSLQEARQYLHGLEFFIYNITGGNSYPNPDHQKVHYVPFPRVVEYLRLYADKLGSEEDLINFKKEVESLRVPDPYRIHPYGILDMDLFLEKIVSRHKALMAKAEEALMTGFYSADFLKENKIKFSDFVVLYKTIEGDKTDEKKLEEMFISYCDIMEDERVALSKEKFFALSFDLNIFTKQKLDSYLGVRDDREFEKKFESSSEKWEEDKANITANIEKNQSMLPNELTTKWKNVLNLIDKDMNRTELHLKKSALIRYKILFNDITNNVVITDKM